MSQSVMTEYLYFCIGMYINYHVFLHSDSCIVLMLSDIRDGTIALRMYVTVVSPYPWDRGAIDSVNL